MVKREWGAERDGKLPHILIPSKTATVVPEFAVVDLPSDRTAALVHEFAVKDHSGGLISKTVGATMQLRSEGLGMFTTWGAHQ